MWPSWDWNTGFGPLGSPPLPAIQCSVTSLQAPFLRLRCKKEWSSLHLLIFFPLGLGGVSKRRLGKRFLKHGGNVRLPLGKELLHFHIYWHSEKCRLKFQGVSQGFRAVTVSHLLFPAEESRKWIRGPLRWRSSCLWVCARWRVERRVQRHMTNWFFSANWY